MTPSDRIDAGRLPLISLIAGVAGLSVCAFVWLGSPRTMMPPYLVGFMFWASLSLGGLAVVLLHQLVGGDWGVPVRRMAEAAAATLPGLAALFLPIALSLPAAYVWAEASKPHEEAVAHAIARKAVYLNPMAFDARSLGYFVLWSAFAYLMLGLSRRSDRDTSPRLQWWMSAIAGPGLLLYFLAMTLASIDWMMSREPEWASTIYGPMVIVGQGLSALAFLILMASILSRRGAMAPGIATPDRMNDLGNLLLAFVMLWAYMAYSQFLIIWSGNLAEEIPWYLRRNYSGWRAVTVILIVFHFIAPFATLLFRDTKRRREALMIVASLILVMRIVDYSWLILPAAADPKVARTNWLDAPLVVASVIGIGGVWLFLFFRILGSASAVPRHLSMESGDVPLTSAEGAH